VVRQQLGEHAALAHPPRDQLRVLAPVVEHQHLVVRDRALERELLDRLVGDDPRPVAARDQVAGGGIVLARDDVVSRQRA
jgi:hypothetical protein